MKNFDFKALIPHGIAVAIFLAITLIYFSPILEGKKLTQGDIKNFKGMSKEIFDFRDNTGEEALWTNSMFGGMPAYQISVKKNGNLFTHVDKVLSLGLPKPANYVFLYLLCFYILLIALKADPWVAVAGAIAFAFSSYFFIILEAGHNTKAHAIAYMAPVLAGMIIAYRGKYLWGAALTGLFFALQLKANHLQITYYLGIVLALYGIFKLYEAIKAKEVPQFVKTSGFLILAIVLALGTSTTNIWTTYEYGEYTTRGKSELTILNKENQTSGLDKDYATAWSYGVDESFTFLVPNFKGGESAPIASEPDLVQGATPQNRQLLGYAYKYHGDQPFTSGPVYIGAIVCFLFVLGALVISGSLKWVMILSALLTLMLGWGKNFMPLTDFFLDYIPGYNKFRAVSMILVIVELAMPVLAFVALDKILKNAAEFKSKLKQVYIATGVTAGLCLLMAVMPSMFTGFENTAADANLAGQLKQAGMAPAQVGSFFSEVEQIREDLLTSDAWRSFILIIIAAGLLWAVIQGKIKPKIATYAFVALILFDMWPVNKRYLNNEKNERGKYLQWESKNANAQPYQITGADKQILADKDPNFRVWNTTVRLDQDGRTPYFHKSIGGYHGAKLKRFQELIDLHLNRRNMKAFDMLNTKYLIVQTQEGGLQAQRNPNALGNAWLVENYKIVANADSEITALSNFDPSKTVIVDQRYKSQIEAYSPTQSKGKIALTNYSPKHLSYNFNSSQQEVAVFSEIYYNKGWNAYIDGKLVPHFRCNYVLRGLVIPAGEHTVEFKFEPKAYHTGETISLIASLLLLVGFVGIGYKEVK